MPNPDDNDRKPRPPERESLRGLRILVARDGVESQSKLCSFLREEGAVVVLVENGNEAMETAKAEPFDLVFMDLEIPRKGEAEAEESIPERKLELPIIALTGKAGPGQREACLKAGFAALLSEPFERQDLIRAATKAVKEWVGREVVEELDDETLFQDPEFLELVNEFIASLDQRILELEIALQGEDWEDLSTYAHRLKGAAGSYGLDDLSEAAAAFEEIANGDRDMPSAGKTLDQIRGIVTGISGHVLSPPEKQING